MGTAIAGRLLRLGHEVAVWNRTSEKTTALAAAGAQVAATPGQLASGSEFIITILTNAAAIDAVYLGVDGLLSGDIAGKLFIEMSTVRPVAAQALAARVCDKGAALIDCPVGGSVGPATHGKLFGFAGGEAGNVARARPILDQLCRRVEHVGAAGAGAAMKLAVNLPTQVYWQALGEALSLCRPLNLDPVRLMDIFSDTSGAPKVLEHRGADIAAALGGKNMPSQNFTLDSVRKDLRTMLEEAQALGCKLPVVERALECYDQASREGLGATDCAIHPVIWSRRDGK
jgi:3-hydroxyisobutyrate dehydrogenase